jgi:heterodisulfide reductase subunit C
MKVKIKPKITLQTVDPFFVEEVQGLPGGENVLDCIQCGVCSGSCDARFAMDYSPMQIIKMIHLGMKEEVLSSSTIWICAQCYTCATRCPRGIEIPLLMSTLKNIAIKIKATPGEKKLKFHESFVNVIKKYGRINEIDIMLPLFSKTNLKELYQKGLLGFRLWRKGKVKIRPSKIKQLDQILKIYEKTLKEEES